MRLPNRTEKMTCSNPITEALEKGVKYVQS